MGINIEDLILRPIKFSFNNRKYNLVFNNINRMQIIGPSPSGKTTFFNDYKEYLKSVGKEREVLFINYENPKDTNIILDSIRLSRFKTVVIDNADIVLTQKMDKVISENTDIYWVLIGRNMYVSAPFGCMGVLDKNDRDEIVMNYDVKW